jgi:hypothetical protein
MTVVERTSAGLQTVIPGCERRTLLKSTTRVDDNGQGLLHFYSSPNEPMHLCFRDEGKKHCRQVVCSSHSGRSLCRGRAAHSNHGQSANRGGGPPA